MILKKYDPVKIIFGLSSLINLVTLFLNGMLFLDPQGPVPADFVLKTSRLTYFKYLPDQVVSILPYWWNLDAHATLWVNIILIILFMFSIRPKFVLPLVFLFEYGLYTRTSYQVHHGQILIQLMLIFFMMETYLKESKKYLVSSLIFAQGIWLYFFTGFYKNFQFWFKDGIALQTFLNLYSGMFGTNNFELNQVGIWLSRGAYMIEILCPAVLLICFLHRMNKTFLVVALGSLSLIHFGSLVFPIFTFPLISLTFLYLMYVRSEEVKSTKLWTKVIVLLVVLPFHLLPFFKINVFPFDIFPLRQNWNLFAQKPKIDSLVYKYKVKNVSGEEELISFDQSFHWRQLRIYLSSEYPGHKIFRDNLQKYYCHKPDIASIEWEIGLKKVLHVCETDRSNSH